MMAMDGMLIISHIEDDSRCVPALLCIPSIEKRPVSQRCLNIVLLLALCAACEGPPAPGKPAPRSAKVDATVAVVEPVAPVVPWDPLGPLGPGETYALDAPAARRMTVDDARKQGLQVVDLSDD